MSAAVLIVEDDEMIREVIDTALSLAGFKCTTASRASTAMEVMGRMRFDIVVLDIHMPTISGIELLRWIRQRHSRMPVLMVSANRSIDTVREAMDLGCVGYLAKPFSNQVLIERVRKALTPVHAAGSLGDFLEL